MPYAVTRLLGEAALMIADVHGMTQLFLGTSEQALLSEHTSLLMEHHRDDAHPLFKRTLACLNGETLDVPPLSLQGTSFQRQVWAEIAKIPKGQTISYSELAERVGRPKAVRAVASACGKNEISLLIPCHRVVGKNGAITGYRWGIEIKERLLEQEKRQVLFHM